MIQYLDRKTGEIQEEKVFGGALLSFMYGNRRTGSLLRDFLSKSPLFSKACAWWHRQSWTAGHIEPFIKEYGIDPEEFLIPAVRFRSFNDFFIRKLKPACRPISSSEAIIPADARYRFYEKVSSGTELVVKGQPLNLESLFKDQALASPYQGGSLVLARLCPSDYHRFHFPVDCIPESPRLINGPLYSVNPISVAKNLAHLMENKRILTFLETRNFGRVAYFEIGATTVGSIRETFMPGNPYKKGDEKGYFEFGGSALAILFEPGRIAFSEDLLALSKKKLEIRCLLGQSLGSTNPKRGSSPK